MLDDLRKDATARMAKCVQTFQADLRKMRTGRAHPSLLEHLKVDYYGSEVPLQQVASINVEDARTLVISPWEKTVVQAIEKAIHKSDLGLTPMTAGTVIRVGRGHTSQHLTDDAFELLGFKESVNYVRDYFSGHIIQQVPLINGIVYAGTFNNYVFRIDSARPDTWSFQCGTDLLNMPVGPDTYLYAAADLYLHTELRNGTSQNYQAGIKYEVASKRAFRIAYNYRTGLEYRGQFFRNHLTVHTVGFYVDY
ncbi:MAG: ribosome recycling factor [Bacteroidetes bacterium]|nr:ribosome recycling factor [Bacteroidota bacterium]